MRHYLPRVRLTHRSRKTHMKPGEKPVAGLSAPRGSVTHVSDAEVLVRARGLTKRFADFTAVGGIDFELRRGEAFGFLGPNGAGKSSTMRMIGCISPPSGGELTILGMDPRTSGPAIRARLGVVPQENTLDIELTVRENMLVYGRYFGLPRKVIRQRAQELLEFVHLADRAGDQVEPLSGGMKRRLVIARSLIITTHYMDEAEQLCDRLVVMDGGVIVAEGSPRELIGRYSTPEVCELRFDPAEHEQAAEKLAGVGADRVEVLADRVLLYTPDGDGVLAAARGLGLEPVTSLVRRSTLEDVFLLLTGRSLED